MIERELLISLLKLTMQGQTSSKDVGKQARIPNSVAVNLLKKLQTEHLINVEDGIISTNADSRLKLAIKALTLGADIECVSGLLHWQEFEDIAAVALADNGYVVAKNVRFKHGGRRWEIDVVGCRKPIVVCIDCKHWSRGLHPSSVSKMAEAQAERVEAFAKFLPSKKHDIPCAKWDRAKFVPVILSLVPTCAKFYGEIPIVPVLMLQDFINQLPANVESLHYFSKEFVHL